MTGILKRFHVADEGAVTVDWVVLTAALLIFGILVASLVSQGATDASAGVGERLSAAEVPDVTF